MVIFWWLGHPELALLIKVEILEGKFLTVAGESAESAKIFPSIILCYMVFVYDKPGHIYIRQIPSWLL